MEGPPQKEKEFFDKLDRLWKKTPEPLKMLIFLAKGGLIGAVLYLSAYGFIEKFDIDIRQFQKSSLSDSSRISDEDCNVLGIELHGTLLTYIPLDHKDSLMADTDVVSSEHILYYIDKAERNEKIKAILLELDSYGGFPVAGEEVADALRASTKSTVALIRQAGASAAYWASTGADKIYASKNSDVGSIGVTSSFLSHVGKNQKDGYSFVQLSAGKYKDTGNPDKPLSGEEKILLIRDINIIHQNFINAVSINRGIPVEDVKKMADGATVLGETAKSLHLIDEIGSIFEVKKYLSEKIGEEVEICWN